MGKQNKTQRNKKNSPRSANIFEQYNIKTETTYLEVYFWKKKTKNKQKAPPCSVLTGKTITKSLLSYRTFGGNTEMSVMSTYYQFSCFSIAEKTNTVCCITIADVKHWGLEGGLQEGVCVIG